MACLSINKCRFFPLYSPKLTAACTIIVYQDTLHSFVYYVNITSVYLNKHRISFCIFSLIVVAVPEVNLTADRTRVAAGDSVTLTCTALLGNPMTYTFSWFHNGMSTTASTAMQQSSSTLSITSIKEDDIGVYSCSVNNGFGIGMNNITISFGGTVYICVEDNKIYIPLKVWNNYY